MHREPVEKFRMAGGWLLALPHGVGDFQVPGKTQARGRVIVHRPVTLHSEDLN